MMLFVTFVIIIICVFLILLLSGSGCIYIGIQLIRDTISDYKSIPTQRRSHKDFNKLVSYVFGGLWLILFGVFAIACDFAAFLRLTFYYDR